MTFFISYAQIKRKEDFYFLPDEQQRILRQIVKEFPMVLETYNLSPSRNNMSTFSVIRILEEMPSLTLITPEDVLRTKDIGLSDVLRTRAFLSDQLMVELMDDS